jgi:hypothetical protein
MARIQLGSSTMLPGPDGTRSPGSMIDVGDSDLTVASHGLVVVLHDRQLTIPWHNVQSIEQAASEPSIRGG